MREQWWNEYIGLPYKAKGRGKNGLDCWGLVRLVYKEQLDIDLPSFDEKYESGNVDQIQEAIAAKKESWDIASVPRSGDVALFRVNGAESHVGVITNPGYFLHVRENQDAVIERIDSIAWKNRYVGTFRYTEKGSPITVNSMPHPLKTVKIESQFAEGSTIKHIVDSIVMQTSCGIEQNQIIAVNGQYIPKEQWETYQVTAGSYIEYRAVATGSSAFRMVALLAVVALAAVATAGIAGAVAGTAWGAGSIAFMGASLSYAGIAAVAVAGAALTMAGTLLVNAIFPTRYSTASGFGDFSGTRPFYSLQGGQNPAQPYGAIPVVLGKYRYTPPTGAIPYTEVKSNETYLRTLLVWGYGPLQVSDLRIGDTPVANYEEVEYETLNGWDDTSEDKTHFNSLYGKDVEQIIVNAELKVEDGYVYRTFEEPSDTIRVDFHFPEGLYAIDPNYGNTYSRSVYGKIQIKSTGSSTWLEAAEYIPSRKYNLQPAWYNVDSDAELEEVYRWTRFSLDNKNKLIARTGALTQDPNANPSGTLLTRLRNENFGFDAAYERLPAYGENEEPLYDVCVKGNSVYQTVDKRDASITGCALTYSSLEMTFAEGSTTREENASWYIRRWTKDPFSKSLTFNLPNDTYDIRISKTGGYVGDNTTFNKCILTSITSYRNARPVVPPKTLAMTAMRIRASNQLNGSVDGVIGTCQSICYDYDRTTSTWVKRPTRNPASLFRYVLQHPANAQRVADNKINLTELATWHEYCRVNKFNFDMVLTGQVSLLDVLKDIAAAGRSSPTIVDGKWTVITDKPRTTVSQHFTPHNSWGFEGTRTLPRIPHAFRIQFSNEEKGFEADERIVYNDGYSSANATLFESLQLPGVTNKDAVYKHARFHIAQLKLRPETYTINVDFENIICTRGDLVRVTHDVPMWGIGSGRIKERVNSTTLKLDEKMPMDAGVQYTIRIRLEDGSSITRTVAAKITDGYYDEITLTSSVTTTQAAEGNLFMFGEIGNESVDLIVQAIEPQNDHSARLTLVDYSPAVYDSDDEAIPAFDSQITMPAVLQQKVITEKPVVTRVASDESAMERIAPGRYIYNIKVSFDNPRTLPKDVVGVQGQIQTTEDDSNAWGDIVSASADAKSINFPGVEEGVTYQYRLRYVDKNGIAGKWTTTASTTVQGRINPPPSVSNVTVTASSSRLLIDWDAALAADVESYEVRTTNSGWGTSGYVFKGSATSCYYVPKSGTGTYTFYVKAIDSIKKYSVTAVSGSYTYNAPANPASLTYTIHDTSTTTSTITLDWSDVAPAFGLKDYVISYGSTTVYANASTITLPANWIGDRTFTVKTRDVQNNVSSGVTLTVTKSLPNTPSSGTSRVDNGALFIDWADAVKTTLPVWGYEVRKNTAFGGSGFVFKGSASQCSVDVPTLVVGINTFYIKTIDTDGNYSADYLTINHNYYQVNDISTLTHVFADTALTNATITFDWNDVKPQYGLAYYEVSYDSVVRNVNASTITLPADWLGSRNFTVKVVDVNGNKSAGYTTSITKLVPSAPINFRASVIDNNVMLYWTLPAKTTLPISHALLKKGVSWAAGELVGEKAGEFTTINETRGGTYTYWLAMVDTDGNQSTPVSVTAKVSEPPDFVFHGSQDSTFSGTKSSALLEDGVLVMPVNLTETFEQHFTTRGWSTPQDQITAGYPIYIQPTNLTGYYQETFDFGTILASSKVTVSYGAYTLNGSPTIVTKIETSDDNVTWVVNDAVTEVFATNFRYVRVTITVSGTDDLAMWLTSLNVRCDAKQITDAGQVSALSTDTNGTIVNLNKEFIDVDAITLTPSGTTAVTAVYDFQDAVLSGTYSVTSNVITVNVTGHGLIAGQKVRLGVSTGTAPSTVVTISTAATNSFTAPLTTANTSGNLSVYPESFRVYLFNSTTGAQVSGTVSWNVRGY